MAMAPREKSLLLASLAAVLLLASVAGCGGDTRRGESESSTASGAPIEVSSTPSPPPRPASAAVTDPARRAYVSKVDAVCGRLDPERGREQERVAKAGDAREAAKLYDGAVALGWKELREVEAVPAPRGERALLRANVFEPIRRQLALRKQIGEALAAVDVPRLRVLRGELDNLSRAVGGFARGYGFQVCGEA